ncbi:MAG: protein kinase [Thermoanaerobaculia bacterium]|jgi:serine/threonine-protein kinase
MTFAAGTKLGPYEVLAPLGKGGMGEVYRARDVRVDRAVALKVLPEEFFEGEERRGRFEREARMLASLNHPGIAVLYSFEEIPSSSSSSATRHLLVMELVEGEGLDQKIASGPLPLEETLFLARQIAEALEAAHGKGIVHRDLKPANIIVTRGGRVKLLDFGLAKKADPAPVGGEDATATGALTQDGVVLGTVPYMSPEQARGWDVDARTDVWAFGCILYEMLAGRRAFDGETPSDTLAVILRGEADFSRLPPGTPPRVVSLLRRTLEKDPRQRLRNISEARADLGDAAGLAAATLPGPAAAPLPSVAVLPFVNMSADPENEFFTDGITEDVIAHLAKIRMLRVTSRTSAMAFKKREQGLREIGAALGVGMLVEGSVRRSKNRVRIVAQLVDPRTDEHLWAETYDRDLDDIFAIQTDVALQIAAALRAELTLEERARIGRRPTHDLEAYQLYLQGRHHFHEFTKAGSTRGLALFEQAVARDPLFALAYAAIAQSHAEGVIGGISGVVPGEAFARAQQAVDSALALDEGLAEAHGVRGLILFTRDFDWKGAEAEFRLALKLSPGSADIYLQLGWLCSAQGRFDESLAMMRRARELDPLAIRSDFVNELMRAGRAQEALAEAQRALALDPSYPRLHTVFGWACMTLGRTAEGLASLERAVELSPDSTLFLGQLGQALGMAGHETRARAILADLEALARTQYVAAYHLAHVHTGLGERDAALDCLERAFEERSGAIYGIKGSYLFASLRDHPRFQALLRRMNL